MFLPYHPELAMFQCGYGPDINVLYHISTRLPRHKGWIFVQNLETNSAPAPSVAYLVELCFFAEYYTYIGINLIKILPYLRAVTEFHQVFSLHCRIFYCSIARNTCNLRTELCRSTPFALPPTLMAYARDQMATNINSQAAVWFHLRQFYR